MKVDFIIDGAAAPAASGATYARRDPVTGAVASEAAAASEADVAKVVEGRGQAFPAWSRDRAQANGARFCSRPPICIEARAGEFTQPMIEEIGATAPWAGFNVHFAASMLREAAGADDADRRRDHPRRQAGSDFARDPAAGRRRARHRAVERAGDPGRARDRRPARLRQYGDPEVVGSLPGDPSADRPDHERRRLSQGRRQCDLQRASRRSEGGCGADRPSGGQAGELHRLVQGRQDDREARGGASEAGLARARRQGAARSCSTTPISTRRSTPPCSAPSPTPGQICMSTERLVVDAKVADAFVDKLAKRAAALPSGDPKSKRGRGAASDRNRAAAWRSGVRP